VDDDAAEALGSIDTRGPSRRELEIGDGKDEGLNMNGEENGEPPTKRLRLSGAEKKRRAKEEARKRKGANKGRKFVKTHDEVLICWAMASGEDCGASNG
jgi:tRNA-dihydrouridine synthase 3